MITCTQHLRAHGPQELEFFEGRTLFEALEKINAPYPRLRHYVLDDQGNLRKHVAVFINGELEARSTALTRPLVDSDQVYLLQALSGG